MPINYQLITIHFRRIPAINYQLSTFFEGELEFGMPSNYASLFLRFDPRPDPAFVPSSRPFWTQPGYQRQLKLPAKKMKTKTTSGNLLAPSRQRTGSLVVKR
jgi:hypothetical protein